MDPKLKNELEQTKAQFDEILKQTEREIHMLNSDLRTLEDEAAKLHKQRVRVTSLFWFFAICVDCRLIDVPALEVLGLERNLCKIFITFENSTIERWQ